MAEFRFIHAADLHLDSPLIGLARKSEQFAGRVDDASRRAFDNLITLAIDDECSFIVIAGDLFDGQWRDYRTGLFFADRMRKLKDAGIEVFIILGNHDAENRFVSRLELSDNVRRLSHRKPETVLLKNLDVAIHGRSFPQRAVTENLALDYPAKVDGRFNIGLLHTACTGRAGHDMYAPCTVEQLVNHGYDYWALGHVHAQELLHTDPCIVYPGNLQGRKPSEAGPKGAMLVTVDNNRAVKVEHRPLDVIRWSVESIDIGSRTDIAGVHALVQEHLVRTVEGAAGRGLAVRLRLSGTTSVHNEILENELRFREEMETIAATVSDEIWVEKIELDTAPPRRIEGADPSIAGRIRSMVQDFSADPEFPATLERKLAEVREKMPAAAQGADFFETVRAEVPARAAKLAESLIEGAEE